MSTAFVTVSGALIMECITSAGNAADLMVRLRSHVLNQTVSAKEKLEFITDELLKPLIGESTTNWAKLFDENKLTNKERDMCMELLTENNRGLDKYVKTKDQIRETLLSSTLTADEKVSHIKILLI